MQTETVIEHIKGDFHGYPGLDTPVSLEAQNHYPQYSQEFPSSCFKWKKLRFHYFKSSNSCISIASKMISGNGFGTAETFGRFVSQHISDILQAVKVKS